MYSYKSSKAFYLQPDRKGEFKHDTIRVLTVDGIKDFENNYTTYTWNDAKKCFTVVKHEEGTIQDKILKKSQISNERIKFVKILDDILMLNCKMSFSKINSEIIEKIASNGFFRDSLDKARKKNVIEIIIEKLNCICSDGYLSESLFDNCFKNSGSKSKEAINNKQILDMFLKICDKRDDFDVSKEISEGMTKENVLKCVSRDFD